MLQSPAMLVPLLPRRHCAGQAGHRTVVGEGFHDQVCTRRQRQRHDSASLPRAWRNLAICRWLRGGSGLACDLTRVAAARERARAAVVGAVPLPARAIHPEHRHRGCQERLDREGGLPGRAAGQDADRVRGAEHQLCSWKVLLRGQSMTPRAVPIEGAALVAGEGLGPAPRRRRGCAADGNPWRQEAGTVDCLSNGSVSDTSTAAITLVRFVANHQGPGQCATSTA